MTGVEPCTELGDLHESRLTVRERSGRKKSASIRRWDWITPVLHHVINPARRLTTNIRRSVCR